MNRTATAETMTTSATGGNLKILGFLGAIGAAAAVGAFVPIGGPSVALVAPFLLALIGALTLMKRLPLGTLSPIVVLATVYLALSVLGPLAAGTVMAGKGVSAQISLSRSAGEGAYLVFVAAAGATAAGAWMFTVAWPRMNSRILPTNIIVSSSRRIRFTAGALSIAPLLLSIVGHGNGLLFRTEYLPSNEAGNAVLIAANTLALPAVAVLGWLTQASFTRFGKFLSVLALVLYGLILFGLATRAFALVPLALALGMVAGRPSSKGPRAWLLVASVASVLLLPVPLTLRGSEYHGILPYAQELANGVTTLDAAGIATNVLFSFQLTGHVAFVVPPLSFDSLLTSLDPRPASFNGWYNIEPDLRINVYTPYNALGELANQGWWLLIGFFFLVGLYLAHLDGYIRRLLSQGQGLAGLLLLALTFLFIVETLEYNLRSCARILYYTVGFETLIALGLRLTRSRTEGFGQKAESGVINPQARARIGPAKDLVSWPRLQDH